MPHLKPAGFFARFISSLFPKRLEVTVRTKELPDGRIAMKPVYLVAGQEIDSAWVNSDRRQRIQGYAVVADESVLAARRRGPVKASKRKAAEHLRELRREGVAVVGSASQASPDVREVRPRITLTLNAGDTLEVRSQLATDQGDIVASPLDLDRLRHDDGWYVADGNLLHVVTTDTDWDKILIADGSPHRLTDVAVPEFLKALDTLVDKLGPVEKNDALAGLSVLGQRHENQVTIDGRADSIRVSPHLVYFGKSGDEYALTAGDMAALQRGQGGYKRVAEGWIDIDPAHVEEHRQARRELRARLGDLDSIADARIPEVLDKLRKQNRFRWPWTVRCSEAVEAVHHLADSAAEVEFRLDVIETEHQSLLEITPVYHHGPVQLSHPENLDALAKSESWIRREETWIRVDRDKCKRIDAAIQRLELSLGTNGYRFPGRLLEKVVAVFSLLGRVEHSDSYSRFLAQLADFEQIPDVPLPDSLRPGISFRPYQKQGFNWLAFLHRFGLNGVLADDMGLGKTLQTLAMLQRAKEQGEGMAPSLIICPTSVVNNWHAEAEKFFADCPVILYTGAHRNAHRRRIRRCLRQAKHPSAVPLVVTSYDIARRDYKYLNEIPWLYVVVDEGHNIKNPDAKRTKAVKAIQGKHKLALTGTPIQNKLEELWSLFDFTMPGFLGTRKNFRDRYGRYDQIMWDAVSQGPGNLKERIRPFVLRRLKESVAQDLPPKIIVDQVVELSPLQVELYKRVLASADYQRVVEEVGVKGVQRSKVLILKVYTTLRSICNHPSLAKEEFQGETVELKDSGKLDCLKELMEEVVDGEHRVLLFCQSTQMLDIIESFFRQWQITFIRLDGDTPPPDRPNLVQRFNTDPTINCFLISTRAGGTGLNLTGADTVIFYDHDWNPANDHQAQDRAYRIGQTKPVTVYRLVSRGTIEEKILQRQELKQTLADEIIVADEAGFKELSSTDLLSLFGLDERKDE
jgi:superfamily II DNA or RNA helicase